MCELTTPEVGDPIVIPDPLAQFETPFETFMGDGAYDDEPVSEAVLNKQPNAQVVVPPQQDGFVVSLYPFNNLIHFPQKTPLLAKKRQR
ncbi:MAG: hypothetical protein H0V39_06175 [Nitrosomonas sp.]|nr:hypothetical protein [Nitrosomonas sp.]MBA4144096.1 hypothetical protein [Nitrosospira sp.]